ncbi:MAG: nicotinamide-nucleotide amidohydrolase family protein [Arthrobacter sp.]|jgi:nicotinamide-nucleotide amidase|nr:nicotinamide-nucleotide amidohydrolase family protein [Arthrobacter sp.]
MAPGSPAAVLQEACAPLARELVVRASAAGLSVATAESLTAGLVAATIADVPGASAILRGGVVSYAVEVKASVLGVDAAWLAEHGPVDPRVAEEMAAGAARVCGADLGVSTTGVAGPEPHGGRPVGTVYLGVAEAGTSPHAVGHRLETFAGDRDAVRWAAVKAALELLLSKIPG